MPGMIRLFAALPVPFDIAEGLVRRQQGLPRARWRPTEALHITLRFFGEVSEPTAADLDSALAGVTVPPFAENEPLKRLALKCENAARRVGLKPEARTYRPHVTLAYLQGSPPDRIAAWLQGHNLLKSPPWRATEFHLYSSWLDSNRTLSSCGSYEIERTYPLH
jgi:RNA 2',3'-cyclic 3'-phosphodiesterase